MAIKINLKTIYQKRKIFIFMTFRQAIKATLIKNKEVNKQLIRILLKEMKK